MDKKTIQNASLDAFVKWHGERSYYESIQTTWDGAFHEGVKWALSHNLAPLSGENERLKKHVHELKLALTQLRR